MTRCRPAVTWTWRTGFPTWSRGCSCRRMRSSCWNQLWPTPCAGWATARSRARGCKQEVLLGGDLWPPQLQHRPPKVRQVSGGEKTEALVLSQRVVFLISHQSSCITVWTLVCTAVVYEIRNVRAPFLLKLMMMCRLSVRQLLQALPSRPLSNGYVQQKRLLSSPSSPKKEVLQSIKR